MNDGGQIAGAIQRAAQQLQRIDSLVEPMRQAEYRRRAEAIQKWKKEREEEQEKEREEAMWRQLEEKQRAQVGQAQMLQEEPRRPSAYQEPWGEPEQYRQSYQDAKRNGGLFKFENGQWVPE